MKDNKEKRLPRGGKEKRKRFSSFLRRGVLFQERKRRKGGRPNFCRGKKGKKLQFY